VSAGAGQKASLAGLNRYRGKNMNQELALRRKWTFRAHGNRRFLLKVIESDIHVLTKALIRALFLPDYPNLSENYIS
jgi:hypothetical protein